MDLDKRACLECAKELIREGSVQSLRYAALELRFCMEIITYEKLRASASHIPLQAFLRSGSRPKP
jgi:hypothetical protein